MNRKIRNSRRQIGKLRLRTILVATAFAFTGMAALVLILVNVFKDEKSLAESNPMVVSQIEVFRDASPVLKGSTMQCLMGIKISVKGNAKKLQMNSFQFSTAGSHSPISNLIKNIRVWNTGFQDYYTPNRQIGAAISSIQDGQFQFNAGIQLNEGDNYFWLSSDIGDKFDGNEMQLNIDLISVSIGTLTYEPDRVTGKKGKIIQNNRAYYSIGNGDISAISNWSTMRDGSGKMPQSFSEKGAAFFIQPGHIMTNTLNACLPSLIIERNGVLQSSSGIKAAFVEIQSGGTFIQRTEVKYSSGPENLIIKNNGNYIHLNAGLIPGKEKQFEKHSTVTLNKYSDSTFTEPIEWGNLVIDSHDALPTNFKSCFKSISGDLDIRSTGTKGYLYTTVSDTIRIGGSLYIEGGRFILSPAADHLTLNISADFILDNGLFTDVLPGKNNRGSVTINAGTLLYLRSGNFIMKGNDSQICINKRNVKYNQTDATIELPDVKIFDNCTLTVTGNKMGNLSKGKELHIYKDALLNTGLAIIEGQGTFLMEDDATLSTEHREGIYSSGFKGCIQTGSRIYSSGANFAYTGSVSPQYTGVFVTKPGNEEVKNLIVKKSLISDVLVMEQPISVKGMLFQLRGNINKNSYRLEYGDKKQTSLVTP